LGGVALAAALLFAADSLSDAAAAFERGDTAAAARILDGILRAQPEDASAWGLRAAVYDAEKKYPEAERAYRRAIRLRPGSATLLNNFANHQLATGDAAGARETWLKALAIDPAHPNANVQLAALEVERKNGAEALRRLDRLPAQTRSTPQIAILEMRALFLAGRTEEAESIRARLSSGGDPRLTFTLGLGLAASGRYADAEAAFSRTLESAPADFDVLYNLGLAASHAGHYERARDALEAARKQRPEDADTLYNLAAAEIGLNHREPAMALLAQAVRFNPGHAQAQLTLAQTAGALGYYADALLAYEAYLKLAPGDETAARERAFMLAASGQKDRGLALLEAHLRSHPRDATAHYEIGIVLAISDPAAAAAHLDKAIALDSGFVPARFGRGVLNLLAGKAEAALPDLELAAGRYPDNSAILDRLGQAYAALDRYPDAVKTLRKAAELAPRDARVLMHLSRALSQAGQAEEARAVLERFRLIGSAQVNRVPAPGMVEFLGLPPEELAARYRAEVRRRLEQAPGDPDLNARYVHVLLEEGNAGEASAAAARLLALRPPVLLAANAGRALLDAGRYDDARPLLEYAAASGAAGGASLDLAIAVFHTAGPEAGLAQLDRARLPERSGDHCLARAQMLDALGRTGDALEALEQALSAAPTRPDLYQAAAAFLAKQNRREDAVRLMDQAARSLPDNPQVLLMRATMLAAVRPEEGKQALKQIQNRWPEWGPAYGAYGIVLEAQRQSEEAKGQLETAVVLGAAGPEVYFYLARATLAATPDRLEEADKAIRQAAALSPSDPYIQALAGRIALDSQDYARAIECLREAVRLRPNLLQAHYRLSQAYSMLGKKEEAARERDVFQRLRDQNPDADKEMEPAPPR
jgi:tetratricopeptide (TPR) repeat protein